MNHTQQKTSLSALATSPVITTIPVTDINHAREFYADTLGLKTGDETAGGFMFECGDNSAVFVYERGGASSGEHTLCSWAVDDLDSVMSELRERGVTFDDYEEPKTVNGVAEQDDARCAWTHDPFGNILALTQHK